MPRTRFNPRIACSISFLCAALLLSGLTSASQQTSHDRSIEFAVFVKDKSGRGINSLPQDDFVLTEGGSPRAITSFSRQEVPISYGLVVDATGSMRPVFSTVIEVARMIVKSGKPDDEAFIVRLRDADAHIAVDWTSNQKSLIGGLDSFDHASGKVSIIESLYSLADHFSSLPARPDSRLRRTALVVITDGRESDSKHTLGQLVSKLKAQHLPVLAICMHQIPRDAPIIVESTREKALHFLRSLTQDTGGYFTFPKSGAELERAAIEVLDYERPQYIIGCTLSTQQSRPSDVHVALTKELRKEGYSVRVRPLTK